MRIQHNIMAMSAYRNYNTNTSALSKNLERLSSGYKINRAGDDAAGLAISEKMRAQITGLEAAQKNVKDGISLVKTAEGAMQEIQDMLNRMEYLATQSANGTYDDEVDRANLQKEVDALKTEINRIAESANFNGIPLLDGSRDPNSGVASETVEGAENFNILQTDGAHYQHHADGLSEQEPSFQIDLRQALEGAIATASIAAGSTFSVTVKVGGASITISGLQAGTSAIASGGVIKASAVDFSNASIAVTGGQASSVSITSGSTALKFNVEGATDGVLTFSLASGQSVKDFDSNMSVQISGASKVTLGSANGSGTVSYNCQTQNVINGVQATGTQLAHGHFELTDKMAADLAAGGVLKIAGEEITFSAATKTTSSGVVGVKDLLKADGSFDTNKIDELARRITQAAASNATFTVGVGTDGKTISLEEKFNNTAVDLSSDEKFKEQVGYVAPDTQTEAKEAGAGLWLQIGDTSDGFNRMQVEIGDMHTSAMAAYQRDADGNYVKDADGNLIRTEDTIAKLDISTVEGAQSAISVIKDAINYVSGVRGDLGAYQNRLEHTANNLSVMAENIQDAESTIRDTDIAEEMMSYTKNNILVQSAQAMLAQANAVPQGVLQLLG